MLFRSAFNFSLGMLVFNEQDDAVREQNTNYRNSGAGKQMCKAVHEGRSFNMLKRMVYTMADFLEAKITRDDGSCIIHAMKMAFKRLGLPWPLGENVLEDRQLILAHLPKLDVLLSRHHSA
jgi:hypothetical protein